MFMTCQPPRWQASSFRRHSQAIRKGGDRQNLPLEVHGTGPAEWPRRQLSAGNASPGIVTIGGEGRIVHETREFTRIARREITKSPVLLQPEYGIHFVD